MGVAVMVDEVEPADAAAVPDVVASVDEVVAAADSPHMHDVHYCYGDNDAHKHAREMGDAHEQDVVDVAVMAGEAVQVDAEAGHLHPGRTLKRHKWLLFFSYKVD